MPDVFKNTELKFGGAFAADKGLITPNQGMSGLLMSSLQLNYSQSINRVYELGVAEQVANFYYIGGRSQGSMSAGHVVGPGLALKTFYDKFSDVCNANLNDIELSLTKAACGVAAGGAANTSGSTVKYKAKFCVLVSIGFNVSSNDLMINENSQLMFSNLEYNEGGSFVATTPV